MSRVGPYGMALIAAIIACASKPAQFVTHAVPRPCTALTGVRPDTVVDFQAPGVSGPQAASPGVRPQYPPQLRGRIDRGKVIIAFVVDTTGRAVAGSMAIKGETHQAFGDAVCAAVALQTFTPMQIGGKKYSAYVEAVPYDFIFKNPRR